MKNLNQFRLEAVKVRSDLYKLASEIHEYYMKMIDAKAKLAANEVEEVLDQVNYAIEHLQDID